MKRCRPPSARDQRVAGPQVQVVGVAEDDLRADAPRDRGASRALTAPCVPTGMNTGVSTMPCGVVNCRARARRRGG